MASSPTRYGAGAPVSGLIATGSPGTVERILAVAELELAGGHDSSPVLNLGARHPAHGEEQARDAAIDGLGAEPLLAGVAHVAVAAREADPQVVEGRGGGGRVGEADRRRRAGDGEDASGESDSETAHHGSPCVRDALGLERRVWTSRRERKANRMGMTPDHATPTRNNRVWSTVSAPSLAPAP